MTCKPDDYWESRLADRFKFSGVGYTYFSEFYNKWLYRAKKRDPEKALRVHQLAVFGTSTKKAAPVKRPGLLDNSIISCRLAGGNTHMLPTITVICCH